MMHLCISVRHAEPSWVEEQAAALADTQTEAVDGNARPGHPAPPCRLLCPPSDRPRRAHPTPTAAVPSCPSPAPSP